MLFNATPEQLGSGAGLPLFVVRISHGAGINRDYSAMKEAT